MNTKLYNKLEFNQVLKRVSNKAHSEYVKAQIQGLNHANNLDVVEKQLKETDEIMRLFFSYMEYSLSGLHDIYPILLDLDNKVVLDAFSLNKMAAQQEVSINLRNYYKNIENKKEYPVFSKLIENLSNIEALALKINHMISIDGFIFDDATDNLVRINRELETTNQKITTSLRRFITNHTDHLMENIITYRNNRAVLLVKLSSKNIIKGIIHDESSSKQTVFIEPSSIIELNNYLQTLEYQKQEETIRIFESLTNLCHENYHSLKNNYEIFIKLDMLKAKAAYSIEIDGIIPKINKDSAKLELYNAKHPLINKDDVVANDFFICNNETKYRIVLISGSNTGGKTVALKMVGLFSLMMQSGIAICAKENSSLPIYSNIFVDIGDEQSIENSLSTFSSHLSNISNIVENVCKHSLVLLDELGSGTDPREGENLALAVLEYLYQKDASVIITTHYSKLKNYAITTDYVRSASVIFDEDFNRPKYKLSFDTFASSNAFEIAKFLGLKQDIIEQARKYYYNDLNTSDELLLKLQQEQIKLEQEKDKTQAALLEYNQLNEELKQLKIKTKEVQEKTINDAKVKANRIVGESTLKADQIIKELKKSDKFVNHKVNEIKNEFKDLIYEETNSIDNSETIFVVGDVVEIIKLHRQGEISKVLNKSTYEVSIGSIKTKVKQNEIKYISKHIEKVEKKVKTKSYSKSVPLELNLIGLRVEPALIELDKYLDDVLLASHNQVRIVHGFGTGALRQAVHEHLKKKKQVKSFEYAKYNEGGQGATIVNIK